MVSVTKLAGAVKSVKVKNTKDKRWDRKVRIKAARAPWVKGYAKKKCLLTAGSVIHGMVEESEMDRVVNNKLSDSMIKLLNAAGKLKHLIERGYCSEFPVEWKGLPGIKGNLRGIVDRLEWDGYQLTVVEIKTHGCRFTAGEVPVVSGKTLCGYKAQVYSYVYLLETVLSNSDSMRVRSQYYRRGRDGEPLPEGHGFGNCTTAGDLYKTFVGYLKTIAATEKRIAASIVHVDQVSVYKRRLLGEDTDFLPVTREDLPWGRRWLLNYTNKWLRVNSQTREAST